MNLQMVNSSTENSGIGDKEGDEMSVVNATEMTSKGPLSAPVIFPKK